MLLAQSAYPPATTRAWSYLNRSGREDLNLRPWSRTAKAKNSDCLGWCRLGIRKSFFLSLSCTELVPRNRKVACRPMDLGVCCVVDRNRPRVHSSWSFGSQVADSVVLTAARNAFLMSGEPLLPVWPARGHKQEGAVRISPLFPKPRSMGLGRAK